MAGIDHSIKLWAPTAETSNPIGPAAAAAMRRNRLGQEQGTRFGMHPLLLARVLRLQEDEARSRCISPNLSPTSLHVVRLQEMLLSDL